MSPADPPSSQSAVPSPPPPSPAPHSSRRAVLAAFGTTAVAALAGCGGIPGDSNRTLSDGTWYSFGHDPKNTNRVPGGAPEPTEHDVLASASWPYVPPIVHEGIVHFAADRQVLAVSPDGHELWSHTLDGAVSGVPALDPDRGRLYVPTRVVATRDGPDPPPASLTVLSIDEGEVVDSVRVGDGRTYGVTVVDGEVYVRSATACVKLGPDGTERWRQSLDPLVYDKYNLGDDTATQIAPAVTHSGVYVPDRDALVKLVPSTGDVRWRVPVDTPYAAAVVDDGGVIQTGWQETVAVDRTGDVRWRRELRSRAAAAAADGDVYVAADDLHELDGTTGETNWQAHLSQAATAAPVVTDDTVVAATGNVFGFRRNTGGLLGTDRTRWQTSDVHASVYTSPVIAAGHVFVSGPGGLHALRPADSE